MTRSTDDYVAWITPWQSTQPDFTETVAGTMAPLADGAAVTASIPQAYDIDDAIGAQLDVVGEWVGRSRRVPVPLPGIYFAFDDALRGFDMGVWKGPYDTVVGITELDDETYRRLLYANIAAKRWDGTVPGAQAAFDIFFIDPATHVFVQDHAQVPFPRRVFAFDVVGQGFDQGEWDAVTMGASVGKVDVAMTVGVAGKIPEPVILALLGIGAIPIKPGGVTTAYSVTTVDEAPLFGFDVQNEFVSGFDTGAWGAPPAQLLAA